MKKVLLHICCGPCAIYPWQILQQEGFHVEGLFYNPNIQPYTEYQNRRSALEQLQRNFKLNIHYGVYQEREYARKTNPVRDNTDKRCRACFHIRLDKTCSIASNKEFDFFTTTLLVSPYQQQQAIQEVGTQISQNTRAKFLFHDFRTGFKEAQAKAKELNLYRQKYCGCLLSLQERNNKVKAI